MRFILVSFVDEFSEIIAGRASGIECGGSNIEYKVNIVVIIK